VDASVLGAVVSGCVCSWKSGRAWGSGTEFAHPGDVGGLYPQEGFPGGGGGGGG
jgi:hypothetical protein